MNDADKQHELVDRLDALMAWDHGALDSGCDDTSLRQRLENSRGNDAEIEAALLQLVRQYANDDDYGLEDIASVIQWIKEYVDL